MNEQDREILVNELVQIVKLDLNSAQCVIEHLLKIGAINQFWCPEERKIKTTADKIEVPKQFYMNSSLFKGTVTYVERQGWCGYEDSDGNVRVQASSVKQLAKRIVKYAK